MSGRRPFVLVVLAVAGLAISVYLTAFQVGLVSYAWDPVFGEGSRRVLTSGVSRTLPVPDASVGAAGYAVDAVLALLVGARVPRTDLIAGALAVIATVGALVAIVLAILQPTVAHALCTLCLCSSAISIALSIGALAEARERLAPRFESNLRSEEASQ